MKLLNQPHGFFSQLLVTLRVTHYYSRSFQMPFQISERIASINGSLNFLDQRLQQEILNQLSIHLELAQSLKDVTTITLNLMIFSGIRLEIVLPKVRLHAIGLTVSNRSSQHSTRIISTSSALGTR